MTYALSTTLHTTFDEAVERTRKALSEQGFGVLTEIDMKATLKAKLGEDMEDYLILGACNPPLAHRAMNADRDRTTAAVQRRRPCRRGQSGIGDHRRDGPTSDGPSVRGTGRVTSPTMPPRS